MKSRGGRAVFDPLHVYNGSQRIVRMSDALPEKPVSKGRRVRDAKTSASRATVATFQNLVDTYQGMLVVSLRTRGLSFADIDDVCQEVWLRAWKHLESGRLLEKPAGWLRQVAMNLVYSSKRGRQQIPDSDGQVLANLPDEDSGDEASQAAADVERRVAIRSCLDALPKSDGEIVEKVYSGMRSRQIAAALGLDVDTVYTRKHRALGRFKQCLEGKKVPL